MDQPEKELEQMATWFSEEGLAPDSPKEAQLRLLWTALQRTRSRLNSVTWDLDTQRSQHLAEMAEVRKSLEQIRIFTEHKDVLTQAVQDENDQLKDQLGRVISLQDSQISEVAKMLYQQGLTELIHSNPSEQVAYLLVERASLLESSEDPNNLTGDGNTASLLGTEARALNSNANQSSHKGAPRHGQSPWKRLFGLHKASRSKHTCIPIEARHLAGQTSSVERECCRLERDLEEGSRRLAMAHNEIRRLTDELESAHLTQRAYEPELQAAQQEVDELRQEVQKLKSYEIVELRKAKELNDRLDLEIRALRSRVRTLDAEKSSLQQMVVSLQEQPQLHTEQVQANGATEVAEVFSLQREVERLQSALQEQQQQTEQVQANKLVKVSPTTQTPEHLHCMGVKQFYYTPIGSFVACNVIKCKISRWSNLYYFNLRNVSQVVSLQREVERLESAMQEQQLLTEQDQANLVNELATSQTTKLIQSDEICRDNKLSAQSACLLKAESEVHSLKQQLDTSHYDLDNLIATIYTKENNVQDQKLWKENGQHFENAHCQLKDDKELQTQLQLLQNNENTLRKECPDYQEAVKTLLATQDECETLKRETCETLICLDKERSKYHEVTEKHKAKLCRAKQKCDEETTWRDEKIKNLERQLSLSSHSLSKEKELTISITVENEKLLVERRRLLQQLNEEEHNKKDSNLTASLSKCRVDFLEMENKKLGNKILHMSNQLAVLERTLQSLHFAEELKKTSDRMQDALDKTQRKQPDVTSSRHSFISGPLSRSDTSYLNLTSAQRHSDPSTPPAALSNSDSTCS
ncbi:coiled-coil domain-containing protein 30 [Lycodopsis pacificus]